MDTSALQSEEYELVFEYMSVPLTAAAAAAPFADAGYEIKTTETPATASDAAVFSLPITVTGDCAAFDTAAAAAELAADLDVDVGQITVVKNCGGGRRRRLQSEFTVELQVVVPTEDLVPGATTRRRDLSRTPRKSA